MTQSMPPPNSESDETVRQFKRLFGHTPTANELVRYQRARTRLILRLPRRVRRSGARLISRL